MSGLALLDVAIGMVFLYLLLSLICSALNESISAVLHARAKFLEKGIVRLLDDRGFAQKLYDHPLIRNLSSDPHPKTGKKDLPAYIPSKNFALALMDLIQPGTGTRYALAAPAPNGAPPTDLLAALQQPNNALPESVKRAVVALVQAAGADAALARQNIEDWFNSTMDRVSGAYKRRTHYVLFVLGILATIAVNADSVAVAKRLATTKTLTSAVTDSARRFVDAQSSTVKPTPVQSLSETLSTLDQMGLPIGWTGPDKANQPPGMVPGEWLNLLAMHWAGWLLTALAISFGAPFWFDVLSRFMVVRTTMKPDDKPAD